MEWLAVVGVFAVAIWFIKGIFSNRLDERDKELQEHYENLSKNRKADDLLHDPDHLKRMRDYYND